MNVKYILLAAGALMALPMAAQETYQDTKLVENELNGTARYVGMGGAMEALGADISTMQTNPAGIGLFRKSQFTLSGGFVSQSDVHNPLRYQNAQIKIDGDATKASFDQVGFVWAMRNGHSSFLNFGFNYHKSRNFDQILTTANLLNKASLNKLSALKYNEGLSENGSMAWNGVDDAYAQLIKPQDVSGKSLMDYYNGSMFLFGQCQYGYIGEYDFNISGNINDRIFLGATFGIHDVNYRSNKYYTEDLEKVNNEDLQSNNWESLRIDGTGYDIKLGAIFRPIADSPFRIGLYVNTPVFYDLTQRSSLEVNLTQPQSNNGQSSTNGGAYDFKVYTPWKFGVSLGHTVGDYLALGATYEYSDYKHIDNRINEGSQYDPWTDSFYDDSSSDDEMNQDTKLNLKGVHTVKLGVEVKPVPAFAIRAGYNYVSPQFNKGAFRDGSIQSPGVGYATSADYTNWKATHRATLGIGYTISNFFLDAAYQYSATSGDFYPFMPYENKNNAEYNNVADATKVNFHRHQVLFTLGYKF